MSVYRKCRHFCSNSVPTFNTLNFESYYFVFIWMEICFVDFSFSININNILRMRNRYEKKVEITFVDVTSFLASLWLVFDLREPLKHEHGEVRKDINLLKMTKTFFLQNTLMLYKIYTNIQIKLMNLIIRLPFVHSYILCATISPVEIGFNFKLKGFRSPPKVP